MRRYFATFAAVAIAAGVLAGPVSAARTTPTATSKSFTVEFGTALGSYDTYGWTSGGWKVSSTGRVPTQVAWSASASIKSVEFLFSDNNNVAGGDYTSGATYQYRTEVSVPATVQGNASLTFQFSDFCQYNQPAGALATPGYWVTANFKNLQGRVVGTASNNFFQSLNTWCPAADNIP